MLLGQRSALMHAYNRSCAFSADAVQLDNLNQAEALMFMARWMLENNPNKPRLTLPDGAAEAAAEAAANARQKQAAMVM
jgi:hypothetical protein